jgi:uncharacterized lipoprotein YmbA
MALIVSGCVDLKPVTDATRYFVLTPLAGSKPTTAAPSGLRAVGIGRVEIPDYLQSKRIALRKRPSEIQYLESLQWAERLDKGIQRSLAANLGGLLGSTNVALSAWRRSDVQAEVHVSVLRFESDAQGQAVLDARWRITNPGSEITWRTGVSSIIRPGPGLGENPDGAVATLSEAVGDLSREIAEALRALPASISGL